MLELETTFKASARRVASLAAAALTVLLSASVARGEELPPEVAGIAATPAAAEGDLARESGELPVVSFPSAVGTVAYAPGRGLHVGDSGLTIGGYSNVNLVRDEGGPANLSLDDLSLFVIWDPAPRFHFFSELEGEDLLQVDGHGHGGTTEATFVAERVYGDLALSDALNARVGKFLTPVGRWNVIHAQPLVWTTSRPLATLLPFDRHATGAALFGALFSGADAVNYTLYGQPVNQLDPSADEVQPAHRAVGARLEYWHGTSLSVGASSYAFSAQGSWQALGGLDLLWQTDRLQVMGEFIYEGSARDRPAQWGLYLQGAYEVVPRIFLVGRYEHYAQPTPEPTVDLFVAGVAWRPWPFLVLKAEYLAADHPSSESPPGFKSSIAILF